MNPLLKWLLAGLAVLVLLAVILAVSVVTLVDPKQYQKVIADAVRRETGRELTLDGTVGLDLFPCCALQLEQAALGNPPGFPDRPFVRVGSARLAIRLWPLLTRRQVEIGEIRLDGLEADLIGRKDGTNNWTFPDTSGQPADGTPTGSGSVSGFSVAGISIDNAQVSYLDEADGSRYLVEQLQLRTGEIRGPARFDLEASLSLTDLRDRSGGRIQVKAGTSIGVEGRETTIGLTDLEVTLDTHGVAGLDAITGSVRSPALAVHLTSDTRLTAPALALDLQLTGKDLPGGDTRVKAELGDMGYDVDADAGTLGRLTAQTAVAGVSVDLDGAGRFGKSNDLAGTVRIPAFSPREVLPRLGKPVPETADPAVLKSLSGTARWFLKDRSAGLAGLAMTLDDTKVTGSLSQELLPDGSKATPRSRFDITVDQFDADRYLAPDAAPAAGGGSAAGGKPAGLPNELLRSLNLEGRARIGRLTVDRVQLGDVDLVTSAAGGRVKLEPLTAKLYGGSFRGGVRLDATGPKTRVDLDQAFSGVDLAGLLGDFADVHNLTGTMTLKIAGTALGNTDDELVQNLGGNLSFALADGVYKGMDVWYEIRRARALLRRTEPPARTGPEETPINALDMSGKIADGKFRTDRFSAEIPFLRVSGKATVDLPKKKVDSDLEALVFEKPVFDGDTSLEDLVNARIPLTVSGPVESPKVRVDLSRMLKGALKESAKEALRDKLLDRLGFGKPAESQPPEGETPSDGQPAAPPPKEDPLKKALDRLFKP